MSEGKGDQGARLKKFNLKNLFSFPEDSGRGSLASISTLVAQVSYDLVTFKVILAQEEEKERKRGAMARGGRRKEMPEERERMPTTGEMERLPKGRARPTPASGLQQQEEAAAVKEEESGGEVENMIATVQDLLRPA